MPSLKQVRGKRATPRAIVSSKGSSWSQWHDPDNTEINSLPPTSSAMSSADPIAAPEAGNDKQAPRPLTFFDLPSETQNEIIKQCTATDLIALSLVSKHFRDLAAARLYRHYYIVFPDDDDASYGSGMDGLAGGLDTLATSDYDYARHLKEIVLESLSGGSKGERAYRHYTSEVSCGKFMNTLFLLALRKAKALETFKWDVRVELSRPVYKSLHDIPALQHLYIRMHQGPSIYRNPPPLRELKCFPDDTIEIAKKFAKAVGGRSKEPPNKLTNPEAKAILASRVKDLKTDHGPPTISGFKNLKTLSILDMDTLDYVKEIKTCIHNSSSTLTKLQLSFSEALARKARKPPPAEDTGDESDQEMDEFGNMIPPPPVVVPISTDDASGPAKTFRAVEAKQAQEAVLAQIFGLESKAKGSNLDPKDEEKKSTASAVDDTVKSFIKDFSALFKKVMGGPSSSEFTPEQKEFMKAVEKGAKKYLRGGKKAAAGKSSKDGSEEDSAAGSSTEKATPSSSSDTSEAGKVDESTETEEKYVGLFDKEDKKEPKTHQSTVDNPHPDDIDVCEPAVEPDSQDADGSAPESAPEEATTGAFPAGFESAGAILARFGLGENFHRDILELALATRALEGFRFHNLAIDSLQYNVIREAAEVHNRSIETKDKSMSEYVRTTRGLTLRSLSIYLIPIKTSVLSRAVDLHVLRKISLLNVGPQAPFWNYLAKENQVSALPLCKIHTDNVTVHFLKFVNQLENLEELFVLERSTKSTEYSFAPKTTVTSENIRRHVLKKHAPTLKRLVIKNENDYTWDANVKFLELLCRKGKNLIELCISFASPALHTFNQYLPGLVSLRALHIMNFRNDDTCHWVMREVPRFIADALSSHPNMKLEYLALGNTVGRLQWKPKPTPKAKDKGKDKATVYSGSTIIISEDKSDGGNTDDSEEEDGSTPGLNLETVECGRFYDITEVRMWGKEVLMGRL